ncbi:MAG TPA: hypothetical protein VMG59_08210 [Phycisphaerae bacterium]|nr:hypothetical protein [Phycisphaerae bacterium]
MVPFESMSILADLPMTNLSEWQNFYIIVGSSAGALIGLQFVVITLIAGSRRRPDAKAIHAFGTPIVVHFGCAMTLSAVMSVPWPSIVDISAVFAIGGLAGLAYSAIVFRRVCRQTAYEPIAEDWFWYLISPTGVYAALFLSGLLLCSYTRVALFIIAGAALCLLLIGIRNAWDTVTHHVVNYSQEIETKQE